MKTVAIITAAIIALALVILFAIQYQRDTPPDPNSTEVMQPEEKLRRISAPRFVKPGSGTIARASEENAMNAGGSKQEIVPVPDEVPTSQSSDDEIKEFLAWLSSLDRENTLDETETNAPEAGGNETDYEREKSLVESVIWEQWKKGYETYDIELYMSAIWEDDFFYTSDRETPDDPSDDIILRGGQQERESAVRAFSAYPKSIKLDLSRRSDIEFLSDSIAMVEYDYEILFSRPPSPESRFGAAYSSGSMIIILESRENSEGTDEWRILEWYDYARK